jgi:peptidoglycan lytic transglycosylase
MFSVFVLVGLVGFTVIKSEKYNIDDTPKLVEEFVPNTVTQKVVNSEAVTFTDLGKMKASWYGPKFHGKKTANGEIYNQMAYTAAHKSLPFGTLLKLTNPRNGKSVIVRINDRGPYIPGRQLDLSKGAAIELGVMANGVSKINVEELKLKGIDNPLVMMN